jgi:hypothetical protein
VHFVYFVVKPPPHLSVYFPMSESDILVELRALRSEVAQWRQEHAAAEAERRQLATRGLSMQRWLVTLQCIAAAVGVGFILFCVGLTLWGYLAAQPPG